jgi:uncharacterized delta-60 repeat protein
MTIQENSSAGMLDPTFGNNGVVTIDLPGNGAKRLAGITTFGSGQDLKIYFAGFIMSGRTRYVLGRLNQDGTPDKTFGNDGLVDGLFAGLSAVLKSFAIRPDGKIVLFGLEDSINSYPCFARFNNDGTLDTEFGTDGYAVIEIELALPAVASASAHDRKPLTRDGNMSPSGVEILPDGKILAFNNYNFGTGVPSLGVIIRLNAQGALDTEFNQIGYIRVVHPDYVQHATSVSNIMVQADGKYLGCGAVGDFINRVAGMFVRFDPDGNPDTSFGENGDGFVLVKDPDSIHSMGIKHMVQQPNQRILGIGNTHWDPREMGVMTSLEPDGTPNIQFNAGRPLFTDLVDEDVATTMWTGGALQKDGKIVIIGDIGVVSGEVDIVVARFIDAKFDPDFNNGQGWVRTHLESGTESATGVVLQDDGKILISAYTASLTKTLILRYLA